MREMDGGGWKASAGKLQGNLSCGRQSVGLRTEVSIEA